MRPIIQKQQQILKQNLTKFENRAQQITYSLNKIQYLLFNNHENEQNKDFIKNEYKFLQTLVSQVGNDLDAFEASNRQLMSLANTSQMSIPNLFSHLQQQNPKDSIKIEQEDDDKLSSQSKYDDKEDDDDEDDEYDEQSQLKFNKNEGALPSKKHIQKDKYQSSSYQYRNSNHGNNNYSSSISESQDYMGNSKDNKYYGSNRQIRKKKYSSELRKKLIQEINKNNLNYRKICKKYNINYGTAYYLIHSIQKEQGDKQQQQQQQQQQQLLQGDQKQKNDQLLQGETSAAFGNSSFQNSQNQQNGHNSTVGVSEAQVLGKVGVSDKVVVGENGRTKYQEEFKQQLYVESSSGLSYKELSDKYKVSYETCYYLINTIKNQASKDQQLNRQLKNQIIEFKERLEQSKAIGQGSNSKGVAFKGSNTIPTTTTLTRAQQAILNGTDSQGLADASRNKEITIDDDDDDEDEDGEADIEIDEKRFINLDAKQQQSNNNSENEELNQLKIHNVLQEDEDEEQFMMDEDDQKYRHEQHESLLKSEDKVEHEINDKIDDKSKQNCVKDEEQDLKQESLDRQEKINGSMKEENLVVL